jgi:hypothetical protein
MQWSLDQSLLNFGQTKVQNMALTLDFSAVAATDSSQPLMPYAAPTRPEGETGTESVTPVSRGAKVLLPRR